MRSNKATSDSGWHNSWHTASSQSVLFLTFHFQSLSLSPCLCLTQVLPDFSVSWYLSISIPQLRLPSVCHGGGNSSPPSPQTPAVHLGRSGAFPDRGACQVPRELRAPHAPGPSTPAGSPSRQINQHRQRKGKTTQTHRS